MTCDDHVDCRSQPCAVRKSLTEIFNAPIEKGKTLRIRKALNARKVFCNEIPQQQNAFHNVINATSTLRCYESSIAQPVPDFINRSTFSRRKPMKKLKFGDSLFLFIFHEQRAELEHVEKQQHSIGERTRNIHKQFNFTVFFFFSSCAHPRENVT